MSFIHSAARYALISLVFAASMQETHATSWLPGNGKSCDQVCNRAGLQALSSGIFTPNGNATNDQFYVCAADYRGDGYRGGFNLRPSWHTVCMVPWAGKEVRVRDYICACE